MTQQQAEALRRAVEASIEVGLASREEGADGYRRSTVAERKIADEEWNRFYEQVRPDA